MKVKILFLITLVAISCHVSGQKFATKNGHIKFFSETPLEKIEAHNQQVNAAYDQQSGFFVFKVLMKSFEFEKALMQEHFNENYVESNKFPNATFLGKVMNYSEMNFSKDGIYKVDIDGKLTLHGVTKSVQEEGTFEIKQGKLLGKAKFNILLSDFQVSIPGTVANNISNAVEITVEIVLDKINP